MCGIVGYIGNKQAQPILINSIGRLEYRGYDSCGIAICSSGIKIYKDAIRIGALQGELPLLTGTIGIGHTRWATHGKPSQLNAHPHTDCSGKVCLVHNGIINNYQSLKRQLISEGHNIASETDTELMSHLIEKYYQKNLEEAVAAALGEVKGSYALAVIREGEAKIVVAKKDSPLIIGIGDREYFIASDVPAILEYTKRVIYLEDGDIGTITEDGIHITSNGVEVEREEHNISWSLDDIQKTGYEHFMLREIHEQPRVIQDTIREYPLWTEEVTSEWSPIEDSSEDMMIIACGTSYHAGLIGKYVIEELHGIPVRVELASEFNHCRRTIPATSTIVLTQSGETADVLTAMKRLKNTATNILVVTNVPDSTASRAGYRTIYTKAGPEVSVAATKTYIAQLITLYGLALSYSMIPGINRIVNEHLVAELNQLPDKVQQVLDSEHQIESCARYLSQFKNVMFIGRGINYPVAMEGALKLKEIGYIHTQGYPAGELKHGPFALLDESTPVIAVVARDNTYDATLNNVKEIKARRSPVIALADESDDVIDELVDLVIRVPCVGKLFTPVVNSVALQLLAYYTARHRGCPIDFPRNLAKSVTVE
jgi:glucosamine--fructose-6-phosphate aminotransferase (isomerizing)